MSPVNTPCSSNTGIVLDLEFNRPLGEAIEIGAAAVRAHSTGYVEFVGFFRQLVFPTSPIDPEIQRLTGLRDFDFLDGRAVPGDLARVMLAEWVSATFSDIPSITVYGWGRWDLDWFEAGPSLSAPHETVDLKTAHAKARGSKHKLGLDRALESCGLTFVGPRHRALWDAANTARLLPFVLGFKPFASAWRLPERLRNRRS